MLLDRERIPGESVSGGFRSALTLVVCADGVGLLYAGSVWNTFADVSHDGESVWKFVRRRRAADAVSRAVLWRLQWQLSLGRPPCAVWSFSLEARTRILLLVAWSSRTRGGDRSQRSVRSSRHRYPSRETDSLLQQLHDARNVPHFPHFDGSRLPPRFSGAAQEHFDPWNHLRPPRVDVPHGRLRWSDSSAPNPPHQRQPS